MPMLPIVSMKGIVRNISAARMTPARRPYFQMTCCMRGSPCAGGNAEWLSVGRGLTYRHPCANAMRTRLSRHQGPGDRVGAEDDTARRCLGADELEGTRRGSLRKEALSRTQQDRRNDQHHV